MTSDPAAIILLLGVMGIALALSVKYWRAALLGVFVLIVFEGALRKWAFPSAQAQIYFVKDVILAAAYFGFLMERPEKGDRLDGLRAAKIFLWLGFLFGCLQVFNPNSPSTLLGLVGLKSYFLYTPLAFVLPYVFETNEQLLKSIRLYLIMAIPVAVLGLIQLAAGPGSALNTYVSWSENEVSDIAAFGARYQFSRTTGTFSYITGYTSFLSFIAFLAVGYNTSRAWRIKDATLPIISLVLVIGAMFTTGSRAPIYSLLVMTPPILLLGLKAGTVSVSTAVRICILFPIIALGALSVSPDAVEVFSYRVEHADDPLERAFGPLVQIVDAFSSVPFVGMGIGVTHNSALTLTQSDWIWWLNVDQIFEAEMPRVMVELGSIGFLLVYVVRIIIVFIALRYSLSYGQNSYRAIGVALTLYLMLGIVAQVVNDPVAGLYYWGAFGLILSMRRLERLDFRQTRSLETVQKWQPAAA